MTPLGQSPKPNKKPKMGLMKTFGAGEETLTLDLFLGKEAL